MASARSQGADLGAWASTSHLLAGDLETAKAQLRDYINATIGFEELSDLTQPRRRASCGCLHFDLSLKA